MIYELSLFDSLSLPLPFSFDRHQKRSQGKNRTLLWIEAISPKHQEMNMPFYVVYFAHAIIGRTKASLSSLRKKRVFFDRSAHLGPMIMIVRTLSQDGSTWKTLGTHN